MTEHAHADRNRARYAFAPTGARSYGVESRWHSTCLTEPTVVLSLRGLHLLVIEDEPVTREIVAVLLRLEGADVCAAATGREALDLVRAQHFDVIVSDLGLPDIPGDVLIRALLAATADVMRVIVVTGEEEPSRTRARNAGAEMVFPKPLDWSQLVRQLAGPAAPRAAA